MTVVGAPAGPAPTRTPVPKELPMIFFKPPVAYSGRGCPLPAKTLEGGRAIAAAEAEELWAGGAVDVGVLEDDGGGGGIRATEPVGTKPAVVGGRATTDVKGRTPPPAIGGPLGALALAGNPWLPLPGGLGIPLGCPANDRAKLLAAVAAAAPFTPAPRPMVPSGT